MRKPVGLPAGWFGYYYLRMSVHHCRLLTTCLNTRINFKNTVKVQPLLQEKNL